MSSTGKIPIDFSRARFNDLFWKIHQCNSRFVINKGGGGSGKSMATGQNEVVKSLMANEKILVLRKVANTLKDSVIPLIKDEIIGGWGLSKEFGYNKSEQTLTNIRNGSQFLFRGMEDPERIKSIQGVTRIFAEELPEFDPEDFDQLNLRLRGRSHGLQFTGCLNPVSEHSWVKKRFFDYTDPKATIFETTYRDNKFIDEDYKEALENFIHTNPLYYQIYVLNEWGVEDKGNKFAYEYSKEKHSAPCEIDPNNQYLYLSFDFNVDPISCLVIQRTENKVRGIDMIQLPDSNIYNLCDVIKARYGEYIPIVTGDATGYARSALVRDKLNYYITIRSELGLSDAQLKIPSVNPAIEENRVLVNACLRLLDIQFDSVKCERLHYDLQYGAVTSLNKLIKDDRSKKTQQLDALDTLRYYLNTIHRNVMDQFKIKGA